MTEHELWVMERMWRRGFTIVEIAYSLGFSVQWTYETISRDRERFPYRKPRKWKPSGRGRPTDHVETGVDDGAGTPA